jgi:hypothetical protein
MMSVALSVALCVEIVASVLQWIVPSTTILGWSERAGQNH